MTKVPLYSLCLGLFASHPAYYSYVFNIACGLCSRLDASSMADAGTVVEYWRSIASGSLLNLRSFGQDQEPWIKSIAWVGKNDYASCCYFSGPAHSTFTADFLAKHLIDISRAWTNTRPQLLQPLTITDSTLDMSTSSDLPSTATLALLGRVICSGRSRIRTP